MAFIRMQKLVRDPEGNITGSSASIIESRYVATGNRNHSRQCIREYFGKVLWLNEKRRSGIFLSASRGLIEYDADADAFRDVSCDDSRLRGRLADTTPAVHTVFGDAYLLLHFLKDEGPSAF